MNNQLLLRTNYANRRRNSIHRNTPRVIWKTRSKHIA